MFRELKNRVGLGSKNYGVGVTQKGFNNFTNLDSVTLAEEELYIKAGLTPLEATSAVSAAALHEGGHIRYSSHSGFEGHVEEAIKRNYNMNKVNDFFQICEDLRVDALIGSEYPGYIYEERAGNRAFAKVFLDNPPKDMTDAVIRAAAYKASGVDLLEEISRLKKSRVKIPDIWDDVDVTLVENMATRLKDEADRNQNTAGSFASAVALYEEFIPERVIQQQNPPEQPEPPQGGRGTKGEDKTEDEEETEGEGETKDEEETEDEIEDVEEDPQESAEDAMKRAVKKAMEQAQETLNAPLPMTLTEEIKEMLKDISAKTKMKLERLQAADEERHFKEDMEKLVETGRSLWTAQEIKEVHATYCKGIHEYEVITYTIPRDKVGRIYSDKNNYRRNKQEFDAICKGNAGGTIPTMMKNNEPLAKRYATKLKQVLINSTDSSGDYARNGKLQANRVWKPVHTGNGTPFFKLNPTEVDGYVVDILIDISGSQGGREPILSKGAYVISRACALAGIPCRVISHSYSGLFDMCSGGDTVMIERYKDYDEMDAGGVFLLAAKGSNRDGLALRVAGYDLLKRPEKFKIMCVLSDGQPAAGASRLHRAMKYDNRIVSEEGKILDYNPYDRSKNMYKNPAKDPVIRDCFSAVQDLRRAGIHVFGMYTGDNAETLNTEKLMFGTEFALLDGRTPRFMEVAMDYIVRQIQKAGR